MDHSPTFEANNHSVRNSQHFMEPGSSLPCSWEAATGPYPETDACSPHIPILFP